MIDLEHATALQTIVGPIGWLVLEAIASDAPIGQPRVEARCSTRSLASTVGVSKDSVARALHQLSRAGIVERVDHRDVRSGRFTSTCYLVDLASAGITVTVSPTTTTAPTTTVPLANPALPDVDQLSLLR